MALLDGLVGEYGEENVAAGVPCVIGKDGMEGVVEVALTEEEQKKFHDSCDILRSFLDRAEGL